MKTTLVVITLAGVLTGLADASPTHSLRKRKVEKRRDAKKEAVTPRTRTSQPTPAPRTTPPTADARATPSSKPAPPAPSAKPAARSSRQSAGATTAAVQPSSAVQPAAGPTGPSKLTRAGKPPSTRFHSRVRTDASRNQSRARRAAAAAQSPTAEKPATKKNYIYRRTWGPRGRSRPR